MTQKNDPSPRSMIVACRGGDRSRREFLHLVVVGAVASTACSSGGSAAAVSFPPTAAGNASSLAVGQVVIVPGVPACIARDEGGIYAMTLICTHEGCDMATDGTVSSTQITCACHGSVFDADGNVVRGPAQQALQHFAVTADANGNLTVDGDTPVSASTRLTV